MSVPPMNFSVQIDKWESSPNRLHSRHISVEKHKALNKMIDDLLDLQEIQPSKATVWSISYENHQAGGVSQWIIGA